MMNNDLEYEENEPDIRKLQDTVEKLTTIVLYLQRELKLKERIHPDRFPKYRLAGQIVCYN